MKSDPFSLKLPPFFAGMSRSHFDTFAHLASLRRFEPDEIIFREGGPANCFYLLANGAVDINTHVTGHPVAIQTLEGGDLLGWSWLFPPYRWHFEARAQKATDAFSFPADLLRELCEKDPAFGYELMRRVSEVLMNRLLTTRLKLVQAERGAPHYGHSVATVFPNRAR